MGGLELQMRSRRGVALNFWGSPALAALANEYHVKKLGLAGVASAGEILERRAEVLRKVPAALW